VPAPATQVTIALFNLQSKANQPKVEEFINQACC
jgi:hypothetical protein